MVVERVGSERARIDVTFILAAFSMGGMELQLAALLRERPEWARELQIEVVTFLPSASAEVEHQFLDLGIRATLIDRSKTSFATFLTGLSRHLMRTRPRIVHTQLDASAGTWGRLAAILTGVDAIVQSDLSIMVGGTPVQRRLRGFLDAHTTLFLPNATAIRDRLISNGVRPERITVLMPGVDLNRFDYRSAPARETATSHSGLVAGFLGRFDPVKRLDILLEALKLLPCHMRPSSVLLAGDGPIRPEVERMVSEDEWLSRHCELVGRQADVPAFLRRIDYLIHPSEIEGLPNAVLEAMAMGKPIVATRVSDVPAIVADAGFIAEPADATSLSIAIKKMQDLPPDERLRLGVLARTKIERDHDLVDVSRRFWEAHAAIAPVRRGRD